MTAPRRLLAAVLAMFILVAFALLLWRWLPGPGRTATVFEAREPAAANGDRSAVAPAAARAPVPPPRLRPAASGAEESPPPMPEGLAQDLEMFDGVQLKSELESIALSHPEVRVLEAACSGLPCRAEAASTSAEQLHAFTLAVHQRFQGHVSIRMPPPKRVPGHELRATIWVGTTPAPPPAGPSASR